MKARNSKIRYLMNAALVCIIAVLFVGCIPPGFSKEKRKEMGEAHKAEVEAWFAQNKPNAVLGKDISGYSDSGDLYAAVSGSYTNNKNKYTYIYDYTEQKMYSNELVGAVQEGVVDYYCSVLNVPKANVDPLIFGMQLELRCENDDEKTNMRPAAGEMIKTSYIDFLPAEKGTAELISEITEGAGYMTVFLDCYLNEYPEFDQKIFKDNPDLGAVTVSVPFDLPYDGVYSVRFSAEGKKVSSCHFEQLPNGMFCGYLWAGEKAFEDKVVYTSDGGNDFSIEIPMGMKPHLIASGKTGLTNYFVNNEGKEISFELDSDFREECPGMPGCAEYNGEICIRNNSFYSYTVPTNIISEGEYHLRVK